MPTGGWATRWQRVPATDRTAVVAHMLARGVLTEDQGVLGVGPMGEREFGRRHFIDVVAAFSSPMLLAVRHGRAELGSVHPAGRGSRRSISARCAPCSTIWPRGSNDMQR